MWLEGDFLRVEPKEKYFKMVVQLGKSDVEEKGDYAMVRSGGKYFTRLDWQGEEVLEG